MEEMFDRLAEVSDSFLEEALALVDSKVQEILERTTEEDIRKNDIMWWLLVVHDILDPLVESLPLGARREIIEEGMNAVATNIPVELIAARSSARIDLVAAGLRARTAESKIGGLLGEDVLAALKAALTKGVEGLVRDLDTSMSIYDRMFMQAIAKDVGAELWVYAGPRDKKNREFCASILDEHKAYTEQGVEQLNEHPLLHSYVPPNVKTLCGGYMCRHMFVPVTEEQAHKEGRDVS